MEPNEREISEWLNKPTEIRVEIRHPFKVGFLLGLGVATSALVFLILFAGIGAALSGWAINNFLNSPTELYEPNPELNP